ncbi:MAG: hypothetical protein K6U00_03300, partial [Armatimonadetes bacterium]|nr:hypothetical protein [Armatimonadota bacterium]
MNRCPWYRQLVVKLSLLAVFVCLLSGCGTIDVSLKTIFNADGSGERIMHMVADGIFAVMLDDRSIDEEASKKGWTVERYNKDSQRHMVLKCKFK